MAYRIKRKEKVGKGIRRILREQLGRAVESARDRGGEQEARVHEVRTRLKRSRAALALIGPDLKKAGKRGKVGKVSKKTDKRLRNRGRRLARPRDLAVQAHTFRILGTRLSGELPPGLLERMRSVGAQMRSQLDEKDVDKALRRTAKALRKLRRRLRDLPVRHGRRAISEGITRTYRKARRTFAVVQDNPTPARLHDWRKQVKLLSNELKIVGRAVPELATRYLSKVEKLGELLGQVHDLDCAAATAERHPRWFGSDADREAVRGVVAEHRVALEREAFALASAVFAGRPRDVRELVETGWQMWRSRKREPKTDEVPNIQAA
jgi:CHAD domain-containing protein